MRLRVLLPTRILVDEPVGKVIAEATNGSFCLLPRHVDFAAPLAPGLLFFLREDGEGEFIAVDSGILVKNGSEVLVSTQHAVRGADLGRLRSMVQEQFSRLEERERLTRAAVARLEAGIARRFMELEDRHRD